MVFLKKIDAIGMIVAKGSGIIYNITMKPRVVLDTNVIVSGLRSKSGASHQVLEMVGTGRFEMILTVPMVLEYEDAAFRALDKMGLREDEVGVVLDYLCSIGEHRQVFFLWRPFLRDAGDDMVLEAAVEGNCSMIVTHDVRDFSGISVFGVRAITPGSFLRRLEGRS